MRQLRSQIEEAKVTTEKCERKWKFEIVEKPEPDHPWDESNQVDGYCLTCGAGQIAHDGNAQKVLDWMARVWP